jgi:hypothetical protein
VATDHWQRRIDRAHKRYRWVVKTLATARKLDLPTVRVNIARPQVNVLAGAAGGEAWSVTRPGRVRWRPRAADRPVRHMRRNVEKC